MKIDLCKSGIEAIEVVKLNHYDLVLMDHMMPSMDGIEATAQIRAIDRDDKSYFQNLPIIALTANAVSGMKEIFIANGFDDFISKPIDTSKLNAVLEKWIPKEKQLKPADVKNIFIYSGEIDDVSHNIEIEGLDVAQGITNTGGTEKNYIKTLKVFHKDGLEKINAMKLCLETQNISLLTVHIHAFKNAFAIIGAGQLSETAKELEKAGIRNDLEYILKNTAPFLSQFETLLGNITIALSDERLKNQNDSANTGEIIVYLEKFKSALIDFDSGAMQEITNILHSIKINDEIDQVVQDIMQNRLMGEYDEAVALIDKLLSKLSVTQ